MKQSLAHIRTSLAGIYPESEINALIRLIFETVCGWNATQFLLNKEVVLSDTQRKEIEVIVCRLRKHEPVQYILGKADFYSLLFEVNENTLIPRPETEELVDWVISEYKNFAGKLLDIGTGSGCIAVSLAKHLPQMDVSAVDISEKALETAGRNAKKNDVKIHFQQCDILMENQKIIGNFDVIVSNPPYVLESEKAEIQSNVLQYEPHKALFVPNENTLLFYKAIADFSVKKLNENGSLYLEINRMFGKETAEMLAGKGFSSIEIRKDLSGNDRMIKCRK
ncbi:MAG: peptide chain release factor N(5)-glutamine methyltransferase [Prevotellaceae bacterium]|nr:peptide chain release factor N(5)-glutamine methyltransferase [Prevotellaceae bacterium]